MKKIALTALAVTPLMTGCMGTNALSGKMRKANLQITENRWGREGVFLGFHALYVYRICTALDLVVFNSVEFWTGTNPINGKSPLVDIPIGSVDGLIDGVKTAQIERIDKTQAKLYVSMENGDQLTMDVIRDGESYNVSYLGKELYKGTIG